MSALLVFQADIHRPKLVFGDVLTREISRDRLEIIDRRELLRVKSCPVFERRYLRPKPIDRFHPIGYRCRTEFGRHMLHRQLGFSNLLAQPSNSDN